MTLIYRSYSMAPYGLLKPKTGPIPNNYESNYKFREGVLSIFISSVYSEIKNNFVWTTSDIKK